MKILSMLGTGYFSENRKNLFPARKPNLSLSQKEVTAKHKKSPIRKRFVPHGNKDLVLKAIFLPWTFFQEDIYNNIFLRVGWILIRVTIYFASCSIISLHYHLVRKPSLNFFNVFFSFCQVGGECEPRGMALNYLLAGW